MFLTSRIFLMPPLTLFETQWCHVFPRAGITYDSPLPPDTSVWNAELADRELELVWLAMPCLPRCPIDAEEKLVVT